jgi:hypothetical protein
VLERPKIFSNIVNDMTGKKLFTFVYNPDDPKDENTHFPTEVSFCRINKVGSKLCALVLLGDPKVKFHEDCHTAADKFLHGISGRMFGRTGKAKGEAMGALTASSSSAATLKKGAASSSSSATPATGAASSSASAAIPPEMYISSHLGEHETQEGLPSVAPVQGAPNYGRAARDKGKGGTPNAHGPYPVSSSSRLNWWQSAWDYGSSQARWTDAEWRQ